jgi:hypothetical protein
VSCLDAALRLTGILNQHREPIGNSEPEPRTRHWNDEHQNPERFVRRYCLVNATFNGVVTPGRTVTSVLYVR